MITLWLAKLIITGTDLCFSRNSIRNSAKPLKSLMDPC